MSEAIAAFARLNVRNQGAEMRAKAEAKEQAKGLRRRMLEFAADDYNQAYAAFRGAHAAWQTARHRFADPLCIGVGMSLCPTLSAPMPGGRRCESCEREATPLR